jgi:hypothetical protein
MKSVGWRMGLMGAVLAGCAGPACAQILGEFDKTGGPGGGGAGGTSTASGGGMGGMVECTTPATCPKAPNACQSATCSGAGVCGMRNTAAGTLVMKDSPGDCQDTALGTFAVGTNPVGIAFDGAHMWVANEGSGNVTEL